MKSARKLPRAVRIDSQREGAGHPSPAFAGPLGAFWRRNPKCSYEEERRLSRFQESSLQIDTLMMFAVRSIGDASVRCGH